MDVDEDFDIMEDGFVLIGHVNSSTSSITASPNVSSHYEGELVNFASDV